MPRIYTRTGDGGETGLFAGSRVFKDHPRIEASGSIDELNCWLGLVRTEPLRQEVEAILSRIQKELFCLGIELACPSPEDHGLKMIGAEHVSELERDIDRFEARLPELRQFILPGGTRAAALLHVARTICRRTERRVVALMQQPPHSVAQVLVAYLNRLGDLLFVLARWENFCSGYSEPIWTKP